MPTLPRGPYWMKTSTIRRTCVTSGLSPTAPRSRSRTAARVAPGRTTARAKSSAACAIGGGLTSARYCAGSPLASAVSRRSSRSATSRSRAGRRRGRGLRRAGCCPWCFTVPALEVRGGALRKEARRRRQHAEHERKGDQRAVAGGMGSRTQLVAQRSRRFNTLNPRSKNLSSPRRDPNRTLWPFHHQAPSRSSANRPSPT